MVKKNYFLKKIWLFVFTSLFLALPTFGQGVFSGYAGAAGSLQNGTGEKKVVANLDAFLLDSLISEVFSSLGPLLL